ncbi:MAG: hypothetical protein NC548_42930 [Lachnospiraceae bacterium]|nr:hypothetical protein [Lachnospiraceae bacterium]
MGLLRISRENETSGWKIKEKEVLIMKDYAARILERALAPVDYPWMRCPVVGCRNGFGRPMTRTHVIFMDDVPDRYIVRKIGELDFWNEWEGFVLMNKDRPFYDCRKSDWEIPVPEGVELNHPQWSTVQAVGDRVVTKDGSVYVVYGFNLADGGAEIYFGVDW